MFFYFVPSLKMYEQPVTSQHVKYEVKYSHEYLIF